MTQQPATDPSPASFTPENPGGPGSSGNARRRRRFRPGWPRWSVIGGIVVGASFTFGYLFNSFFYCQAQFSCSVSPIWLIVLALIGSSAGALFGWTVGKFFNFFYRVTRVD